LDSIPHIFCTLKIGVCRTWTLTFWEVSSEGGAVAGSTSTSPASSGGAAGFLGITANWKGGPIGFEEDQGMTITLFTFFVHGLPESLGSFFPGFSTNWVTFRGLLPFFPALLQCRSKIVLSAGVLGFVMRIDAVLHLVSGQGR